jgi:hypothetical protein
MDHQAGTTNLTRIFYEVEALAPVSRQPGHVALDYEG